MRSWIRFWIIILLVGFAAPASAGEYNLDIAIKDVMATGKPVKAITINGQLPGPTMHWKEGEDVVVHVTNHMDVDTSIHWHGLLIPGEMDGVPGLNGFPGIRPGETFTYHFKVRQAGTYWYHSHSNLQEQAGHYGSIVIEPKEKDSTQADRDYVVLLSDFTEENPERILQNLKADSDYYNHHLRTVRDFIDDVKEEGFSDALDDRLAWGDMRMGPTDLADVSGYTFLINGKSAKDNWTGIFKPGERVRLRFINASSMSFFDVRIPGLKMQVVQADGQDVVPVDADEFRIGVAETYDVIVTPKEDKAYTIMAEPIDRTGYARGTLAPHKGMEGKIPAPKPRTLLTMDDMGMEGMDMGDMDMSGMGMGGGGQNPNRTYGWANMSTPKGQHALEYKDLKTRTPQKDTRKPTQEITLRLGGNMDRYIWTINGATHHEAKPIRLKYGERVRMTFVNETMMAHPMHLHGMFVQLENGQPPSLMPSKHTIIVPPGKSVSVVLTANEEGEWAFHCHLLYHMASGMMTELVVSPPKGEKQ